MADADAALQAAARCIASGASERVRAHAPRDAPTPVGLVVQRQIQARTAGVCFTVDPAGRDRAVVIEAVRGSGEALVAGRAAPERWRVYRSGLGGFEAWREAAGRAVLDEPEAVTIARQALELAARLGRSLDLEWAADATGLFWLQARPVTAAALLGEWEIERATPDVDDGPVTVWANWNVRETMPDPFTPLNWSLWREVVLPVVVEDLTSVRARTLLARQLAGVDLVHGRLYWNMNAMLAWPFGRFMLRALRSVDARAATALTALARRGVLTPRRLRRGSLRLALGWLATTLRATVRVAAALQPRRALATLQACGQQIAARPEVAGLSDEALLAELRLLGAPECRGFRRAQQMLSASMLMCGLAERAFRPHPEARRLLFSGLAHNPTTGISLGIEALVEAARPLASVFAETLPARELQVRLGREPAGAAFLALLGSFLDQNGQRCPKEFDIASPRWAEDPTMVLDLVRVGLEAPPESRASARLAALAARRRVAIDAAWRSASPWKRPWLRLMARAAEAYMPLREAPKHHAMHVFRRMRLAALELGRRLVRQGALASTEDVFFLELPELEAAFRSQGPRAWPVADRRARHAAHHALRPPEILRSDGVPVQNPASEKDDGAWRGVGASLGRGSGPVRVLREPNPMAMRDGDVLVVEFADPGWTPLFPRAAGLVMEVGGMLCHAAVIARELGIPAVFGVPDATRRLRDGQLVEVDGEAGTVRVLG